MNQNFLAAPKVSQLLEDVDLDLAQQCQAAGCQRCRAKLHRDDYPRKPRGGPSHWDKRHSFTCAEHRHRTTPASVRYLGAKVYVGAVVVLLSALHHGISQRRLCFLRQHISVDRRTLAHWRKWWLERFAPSAFWKSARANFMPLLCELTLPLGLCERFGVEHVERLVDLLKFLAPITTTSHHTIKHFDGGG